MTERPTYQFIDAPTNARDYARNKFVADVDDILDDPFGCLILRPTPQTFSQRPATGIEVDWELVESFRTVGKELGFDFDTLLRERGHSTEVARLQPFLCKAGPSEMPPDLTNPEVKP